MTAGQTSRALGGCDPAVRGSSLPDETQRNLEAGAAVAVGGKLAGRGVYSVAQVVVARVLGPFDFGLWATGWTVIRLLTFCASLGLDKGVVNFGARCWPHDRIGLERTWKRSLLWATGFATTLGLFVILAAPWIGLHVFHQPKDIAVLRLFAPALPLGAFLMVAAAGTRATREMKYAAMAEDLGLPVFLTLFVAACAVLRFSLYAVVAATVASLAVCDILLVIFLLRLRGAAHSDGDGAAPSHARLLSYSLPAVLTGLFGGFVFWTDRLLLAALRGPDEVGIYQAVSQSPLVLNALLTGIASVAAPMTAVLHQQRERVQLRTLYRTTARWTLFCTLPPALVGVVGARELLDVFFGRPYGAGAVAMSIVLSLMFLGFSLGPVGTILTMIGRQNEWMWISLAGLILNVVLCLALIPRFGISGAACATGLSALIYSLLGLLLLKHELQASPLDRRYWSGLAFLAAALTSLGWVDQAGWAHGEAVPALAAAFGLVAVALRLIGLHPEDASFVATMRTKLKGLYAHS